MLKLADFYCYPKEIEIQYDLRALSLAKKDSVEELSALVNPLF